MLGLFFIFALRESSEASRRGLRFLSGRVGERAMAEGVVRLVGMPVHAMSVNGLLTPLPFRGFKAGPKR